MEKCRFCHSSHVVKRGFRKNESGRKQLFLCNACKKKFTADDNFLKMRHSEKTIMAAVNLYGNHSAAEVKDIMRRKGVKVSRWTIIKWSKKYV